MARRQKRKRNLMIWGIILVILIAVGVAAFLIWQNEHRDDSSGEKEETQELIEDDGKKEEKKEKAESEAEEEDEKKVKQYDGEDPNKAEELSGAITYAAVNGDKLMIRVNIDQYIENGTCTLGLRRAGTNIYSDEARIVASAATATCEGFDVPVADLGSGGTVIVIYLDNGEKTGEINGEVAL